MPVIIIIGSKTIIGRAEKMPRADHGPDQRHFIHL